MQLLDETDVQIALAHHLQTLRQAMKLSREALADRSTVPASTLKKFERTGQISLRQFLLLWQSLDDLHRVYALTKPDASPAALPQSIEEVLRDGF